MRAVLPPDEVDGERCGRAGGWVWVTVEAPPTCAVRTQLTGCDPSGRACAAIPRPEAFASLYKTYRGVSASGLVHLPPQPEAHGRWTMMLALPHPCLSREIFGSVSV